MSSDETTGSGKIWSCEVSLTAKGYSERKPQLRKEKTWAVALCSKYVPRGTDMWTVHPQIQHVQSCTAWSHVTTRTRLAQELQSSAVHTSLCLQNHCPPRVCLVLCRTGHWPPAQVLSHPFHRLLLPFRHPHLCTQALWFSSLVVPAMFHGRVADQHKSHLSQVTSPSRWDQRHRHRSDRAWRPRAQKNWVWQEYWDRSVSKTGKISEKL